MKLYSTAILFLFLSALPTPSYPSQRQLEFLGTINPPENTFDEPYSLAVDKDGRIAFCDISKRTLLFYYPTKDIFITTPTQYNKYKSKLKSPSGIRISSNNSLVVADTGNNRIAVFDKTGAYQFSFGGKGGDPGYFKEPEGVAIDSLGRIYVADSGNSRIQVFSKDGIFLKSFGTDGKKDGDFDRPTSIAVHNDEYIYVVDSKKEKVLKFDMNGKFILGIGGSGDGSSEFDYPGAIAVDSDGFLYVVDRENYRIQKFDDEGNFITSIGSKGKGRGQFLAPIDISIDHLDNIFVQDSETHTIQKFKFTKPLKKKEAKGWMFNPPKKVKGIKASFKNGRIQINWQPNSEPDVNNYIVLRKDNKSNQFQQISIGTEVQFTDSNIQDGLTYVYVIEASDSEHLISQKSEEVSVSVEISGAIKKAKIAVFTFKEASGKAREAGLGEATAEFLTTSLVNQGYFRVIEREQLRKILEEQSLSQSGALEAAKKIGDIIGIDIFLLGSITILGNYIEIDSRLIDAITGSIVTAQNISSDGFSGLRKAVNEMSEMIKTNYHTHLGTVMGQISSPSENIQVALTVQNRIYTVSPLQPETGYFSFSGVLAGLYQLEILSEDYKMDSSKHSAITVIGGKTVNSGIFNVSKIVKHETPIKKKHTFIKQPEVINVPPPVSAIAPPTEIKQITSTPSPIQTDENKKTEESDVAEPDITSVTTSSDNELPEKEAEDIEPVIYNEGENSLTEEPPASVDSNKPEKEETDNSIPPQTSEDIIEEDPELDKKTIPDESNTENELKAEQDIPDSSETLENNTQTSSEEEPLIETRTKEKEVGL